MLPGSLVVVLLLVSAVVCAYAAVRTHKVGKKPGSVSFLVVLISAIGWTVTYAVGLLTFEPVTREGIEVALWVWRAIIPVAWIVFALEYTGRGQYLSRPVIGGLSVSSAVTVILAISNNMHHLMWDSYDVVEFNGVAAAAYQPGPWLFVQTAYGYVLIGLGIISLLEAAATDQSLYASQGVALALGTLFPTVANAVWLNSIGSGPTVDFSPIAFALTGGLFTYALFRHDLFTLTPATWRRGHRTAIGDFDEGVVILDSNGQIININDALAAEFGLQRDTVVQRPLREVLTFHDEFNIDGETQIVSLETVRGRRVYSVVPSAITDRHDRIIGYTLTFHDITKQQERQQRLEVLDRILRHNLRNKMTIIMGLATQMVDTGSDSSYARRIKSASTDLIELSEKVREIDTIVSRDLEMKQFSGADLASALHLDMSNSMQVATDFSGLANQEASTDPVLLSIALDHVLAALQQHGAVEVSLVFDQATDAEWWSVTASSDTAEIPETTREAVLKGTESQLTHGSDVDLWLAKWAVVKMGGEIDINRTGSEVCCQFPHRGQHE